MPTRSVTAHRRARILRALCPIVGAMLGIVITAILCRLCAGPTTAMWLIAPLGASAVLVFAVPASPLAQP